MYDTYRFECGHKGCAVFENSLPLGQRRLYRICGIGKDLEYRSTSAPLLSCICLQEAGLR